MYSGIIQSKSRILEVTEKPGLLSIVLELSPELREGLEIGASVSVNGVCLTVAKLFDHAAGFDIMQQTLDCTTLGTLRQGHQVNTERSLKYGQEIGGHQLSGHVDTQATIVSMERPENNFVITFRVDQKFQRFIFERGYIALNGASLTLAKVDKAKNEFTVYLIPETLRLTTFSESKVGDKVNVEIDRQTQVIVETVERVLEERGKAA